MGNLKGWAVKKAITPSMELLDTLREKHTANFSGVYEDTFVDVIMLDNGVTKFVLATAELGMFPGQQRLADRISAAYGVPVGNIWMACTHNHQMLMSFDAGEGPSDGAAETMNIEYTDFVHAQVMDALAECMEKMVPVRIGYGKGNSYINVSRDCPTLAGTIQSPNYAGFSDKTLAVLKMETADTHAPKAVFANYGMHNNVLFGHIMNNTFTKAGGDLSGAICRFAAKGLPEDCMVSWGIAAAGDQNPMYVSFDFRCEHDGNGGFTSKVYTLQPEDSLMLLQHMASKQGQDILTIQAGIHDWCDDLQIKSSETFVTVRGRKNYRSSGHQVLMPGQVVEKIPADDVKFRCRLTLVGDIAFVGINCEAYSRLGALIKDVLPYENVILLTMTYGHAGYVPDAETEKLNGFGTMATMVYDCAEMETAVIGAFKALAAEMA